MCCRGGVSNRSADQLHPRCAAWFVPLRAMPMLGVPISSHLLVDTCSIRFARKPCWEARPCNSLRAALAAKNRGLLASSTIADFAWCAQQAKAWTHAASMLFC